MPRRIVLLFALAVLATGCGAQEGDPSTEVRFGEDVQPFLTESCDGCHSGDTPAAGLVLVPDVVYENLVEVESTQSDLALVEPGDPEASYLLHKLRGSHLDVGGSGVRMPIGGSPLPDDVLEQIEAWIAAGAPND